MLPVFARERRAFMEERLAGLREYSETTPVNRIEWRDRSAGIITSGISYQYVREALPDVSVLKLGLTWPLPEKLIRSFAEGVRGSWLWKSWNPSLRNKSKLWGWRFPGKPIFPLWVS